MSSSHYHRAARHLGTDSDGRTVVDRRCLGVWATPCACGSEAGSHDGLSRERKEPMTFPALYAIVVGLLIFGQADARPLWSSPVPAHRPAAPLRV